MTTATFYNKRLLCYTDDADFTDYQGIGADPMYKRYESVYSVIANNIEPRYRSFLACPHYDDGHINWYADEWNEMPRNFMELEGEEQVKYTKIKDETIRHYQDVLKKLNSEDYSILSGALKFIDNNFIYCYDTKIILIAWGMRPDTNKHVVHGSWVKGLKVEQKFKITFDVGTNGRIKFPSGGVINRKKGYRLTVNDIPEIIANDGFIFSSWSPSALNHEVIDHTLFTALYSPINSITNDSYIPEKSITVNVTFDSGCNGTIESNNHLTVDKGYVLTNNDLPVVYSKYGYKFAGWVPDISQKIESDTLFTACYDKNMAHCSFVSGDNGELVGNTEFDKPIGSSISQDEVPNVNPKKGYKFSGWNTSPLEILNGDTTYVAQYESSIPWYKKWWMTLTGGGLNSSGCLKWVLRLLLLLLLMVLLSYFFKGCVGCSSIGDNARDNAVINESITQIERIEGDDGISRDNNGEIDCIVKDNGDLPEDNIVSPILDKDGTMPPIIDNEGMPNIIDNRLNIYFEDENADINKWVKDFKRLYPSDEYKVIGHDKNVKMIQIQIPENQRAEIKDQLTKMITDQQFFIVDESIITLQSHATQVQNSTNQKGWHLQATNIKQAWSITKGDSNVVIAIVDDGIDTAHPMFEDRIHKAYNVFTQNNKLSQGEGHGTHVAGLAAGSDKFISNGAAGIAPRCKIMPIQVFDNGICTFSSIASGIMYAIHNGADVVNISIGPSFKGLSKLPINEQQEIANKYFKNEERVYRHIIKTANDKNVILVFAAGNDNVVTAILPECRATENTINVAAVSQNFKACSFTNYSTGTNISAPGESIYSSFPKDSFKMLDGTSMSAPIVSGTVALMKSINPKIKVGQIIEIMQKTGRNIDTSVPPMLIIDKALSYVKSGDIPPSNSKGEGASNDDKPSDSVQNNDDYSELKNMLEQLKAQRDSIDKKITNLENEIKK